MEETVFASIKQIGKNGEWIGWWTERIVWKNLRIKRTDIWPAKQSVHGQVKDFAKQCENWWIIK